MKNKLKVTHLIKKKDDTEDVVTQQSEIIQRVIEMIKSRKYTDKHIAMELGVTTDLVRGLRSVLGVKATRRLNLYGWRNIQKSRFGLVPFNLFSKDMTRFKITSVDENKKEVLLTWE